MRGLLAAARSVRAEGAGPGRDVRLVVPAAAAWLGAVDVPLVEQALATIAALATNPNILRMRILILLRPIKPRPRRGDHAVASR